MNVKIPVSTNYIREAMKYLTPESTTHYVYGMLTVGEMLDGYVESLKDSLDVAGLRRQEIAWQWKNMNEDLNRYRSALFAIEGGERMRSALKRALDMLSDEYHGYMWDLFRAIDQAALAVGFPSDIAKCLANASMVNILAQYVRFNDNKLSKSLEKVTMKNIQLGDPNIRLIERRSGKIIDEIDRLCPDWKIDLNQVESVQLAVKVIDVQLGRVLEVVERLNKERVEDDWAKEEL